MPTPDHATTSNHAEQTLLERIDQLEATLTKASPSLGRDAANAYRDCTAMDPNQCLVALGIGPLGAWCLCSSSERATIQVLTLGIERHMQAILCDITIGKERVGYKVASEESRVLCRCRTSCCCTTRGLRRWRLSIQSKKLGRQRSRSSRSSLLSAALHCCLQIRLHPGCKTQLPHSALKVLCPSESYPSSAEFELPIESLHLKVQLSLKT